MDKATIEVKTGIIRSAKFKGNIQEISFETTLALEFSFLDSSTMNLLS